VETRQNLTSGCGGGTSHAGALSDWAEPCHESCGQNSKLATDERAEIARMLVAESGVIAIQSLNEFTDVSRRKLNKGWNEIESDIEALLDTCALFENVTADVHAKGRRIAERYQLRIFDAMLIATALEAKCSSFISEDLQSGMMFEDRLTASNPFG
jgi:predicted nucleic acid-binding protein